MVEALWKRIEAKLRARRPPETRPLPPGASPGEIAQAEAAMGVLFAAALRESYLLHNGSSGIWICEQGFLLPISTPEMHPGSYGVLNIWQTMLQVAEDMKGEHSQPAGPIRDDWWNRGWIPVTENEGGDFVCVDMAPAPGGRAGQMIDWWHEQGATKVLAPSFEHWLASLGA